MSNSELDAIISIVEREKKAFLKKDALDTSNQPLTIVSRTEEVMKIARFVLDYKQGYVVPLVSIYGRSGTGKSTLVRHVCNYLPEIKLCFVNLRKTKTVFGGVNLILNELDQPSLTSAQGMNLGMQKIQETILDTMRLQKKKLLVLVLDEFDVIFYDKRGNPSDFVYKLVEMIAELKNKGCLAMIITISNNILTDYNLDDRIKSRIGNSEIFFRPYSNEEMLRILRQRAEEAFSEEIDDSVLERCTEISFLEHGDARRAVDLLRVSAEIAAKENKKLAVRHVNFASQKIQKDRVEEVLASLSNHSQWICKVLAAKSFFHEKDWHTTQSIYESYKKYSDLTTVTYRRFSELLTDLGNSGILVSSTSSKGQNGYNSEFKFAVDLQTIIDMLDKTWWKENVQIPKTTLNNLNATRIKKSDSKYNDHLISIKLANEWW
jgi:cell division control protein 6